MICHQKNASCIQELEAEVANEKVPVLVATDCLSEGIDLQHTFDAVVHYDLCWNPRHEQREARWTAGQARTAVQALMLHGGAPTPSTIEVRTVILEKEKTIRKELGVSVPIPAMPTQSPGRPQQHPARTSPDHSGEL